MRPLIALLILATAAGQPGQRAVSMKLTAGPLACTFTNFYPRAETGLHIQCTGTIGTSKSDTSIQLLKSHSGQVTEENHIITWTFQRPTQDGALLYKLTADGVAQTGSL